MLRMGPYSTKWGHLFWVFYDEETRKSKSVFVHRVKIERHLKRKLKRNEVVHHIDGNPKNNKLSNLEVMTRAQHTAHHAKEPKILELKCPQCGKKFLKLKRKMRLKQFPNKLHFCSLSCGATHQWTIRSPIEKIMRRKILRTV